MRAPQGPRTIRAGEDFERIYRFLDDHYRHTYDNGAWLPEIWEYAYTHPGFEATSVNRMAVWDDAGRIVAAALYEMNPGEAFLFTADAHRYLFPELLEYAEESLAALDQAPSTARDNSKGGAGHLDLFISELRPDFAAAARDRGFLRAADGHRPIAVFEVPDAYPEIGVPDGFFLTTMAEDDRIEELHRVLWRGFDHSGEPPAEDLPSRRGMQSGPHYRKDLAVAVLNPEGRFVSFCGMWYNDRHRYGYVEPVATDPDYRRRGLGKAAVLEGMRRCAELGAERCYVGSDQEFYHAIGFTHLLTEERWQKRW